MNPVDKSNNDETSSVNEETSRTSQSMRVQAVVHSSVEDDACDVADAASCSAQSHPSPSSCSSASSNANSGGSGALDMKRSAVKTLVERYFYQLQGGCGNARCTNENCASSGKVAPMTPNEIAAKAIQLFTQDAKLCEVQPQTTHIAQDNTADNLNEPPSSSATNFGSANSQQDTDMLSPNESSCSSTSTITSCSNSSKSSNTTTTKSSSVTTPTTTTTANNSEASPSHSTRTNASVSERTSPLLELKAVGNLIQQPKNGITTTSGAEVVTTSSGAAKITLPLEYLDAKVFEGLIDEWNRHHVHDRLTRAINDVFSSVEKLSKSFRRQLPLTDSSIPTTEIVAENKKLKELLAKSPRSFKKEDLRALEGETDKDEDSTQQTSSTSYDVEPMDQEESCTSGTSAEALEKSILIGSNATNVDLESFRRVKKKLFALDESAICDALNSSVNRVSDAIRYSRIYDWEKVLHCLVICFDMATNSSNNYFDLEYLERSLKRVCTAAAVLPVAAQARLARIWAKHSKDYLKLLVQCCQQLITLQVIIDEDTVQENPDIIAITKVLKIAFYANLLAGQREEAKPDVLLSSIECTVEEEDIFVYNHVPKSYLQKHAEDKLEKMLDICSVDCRVPVVPFEDFYNEPLSDAIQMDRDYLSYKNLTLDQEHALTDEAYFTFMMYSFVLTPATKVIALYYDSRIRMYSERNSSLYSLLNYFGEAGDVNTRPDLKLTVRRDNIIDDALIGLELVAMTNPKDLKKQLVVEFMGEQGIDEGGVSKEFFQLIVEEVFNPDFGMFTHQEETNTVWFNTAPFENGAQFTLIGIIIGLAIYNNIILAVNFPMVVYRKLMGCRGTFFDLKDWNPTLYRSLKSMLEYEDDDFEEVFMQTFKISYNNVFGEVEEYELITEGADTPVCQKNKKDFVELYSDYMLNKSIQRHFNAFKKGFEMVTDESPLKLLFRPEEIELLVCGSRLFDFVELEKSTEYEGGYTANTQIIKDFWCVVHSMPEESKRKLLEFTTGSDRVPVGGLSRLKLLITRHGPDSDRLPTSHTCFNVLLLPEYSSKEKLEDRLLKAINYSKGFGLL